MDIIGIKENNLRTIINTIRFEDGLTKKEISLRTGLSFATVSNLCNDLISHNVLTTKKNESLSVGRKPQDIYLNKNQFCTICINLQFRGKMGLAVLNFRNEVIFSKNYNIENLIDPVKIIAYAHQLFIRDFLEQREESIEFIGVGVAVSSIFDIQSEILINCAIDFFKNVPLKSIVQKEFGLPVYIDNESKLCALSVSLSQSKLKNIVYLHISEGVGLGVVVDRKIVRGHNGYAGEIAHIPIGDPKIKCLSCDQYGCIESSLSINGFLRSFYGKIPENKAEQWNLFIQSLKKDDEKALELTQKNGKLLGVLASVLINIFDPEALYIGGDIAAIFSYCESAFTKEINNRCPLYVDKDIKIICDSNSELTINIGINEEICRSWLPNI